MCPGSSSPELGAHAQWSHTCRGCEAAMAEAACGGDSGRVSGARPPPSAFSPGRRELLALSGLDGRIAVWESGGGGGGPRREFVPSAHLSATCTCLAWAPNRGGQESHQKKKRKSESGDKADRCDLLAIGTATGPIFLYSVLRGELHSKLVGGHEKRINCIGWHQEEHRLYSGSDDKHITEWNTQTCKVRCRWKGDSGSVCCLCVSPDGKMLLSAGRTIKLWDLETKTVTRQFTGHSSAVTSLIFIRPAGDSSNDSAGLYFLSAALHDRLISVWQVRADKTEKNAVLSFTLSDSPVAVDLAPAESKDEPLKLAVVCRDGRMNLFHHVLNGNYKKPVPPSTTVQIATSGNDDGATPTPLPILSAAFHPDGESILLYYGSTVHPVTEKVALRTDEPHILLVRDVHKSVALRKDAAITKVKTPVVKSSDTNILVPGIPGHSAALSVTCRRPDGKRKPEEGEATLEERLGAMDIDLPKVPPRKGLPVTDNFSVLLVQGLESNDPHILNRVFQTKNESLIKNTVARIPVYAVLPLVHELTKRLQGHPSSALLMVRWMKSVLINHASYLSTLPDLVPQLGTLYQLMETRVKTLQKVSRLNGKLYLLITQVAASEIAQRIHTKQEAQVVYEEESSDEESEEEEGNFASDDNCEEEDEDEEGSEVSDSEEDMNVDKVHGDSDGDPGEESEEE